MRQRAPRRQANISPVTQAAMEYAQAEQAAAAARPGFFGSFVPSRADRFNKAREEELYRLNQLRLAEQAQQQNAAAAKGLGTAFMIQNEGQRMSPGAAMAMADIQQGLGSGSAATAMQSSFINPAVAQEQARIKREAALAEQGQFGTPGLDLDGFQQRTAKAATLQGGADALNFLTDVVGSATDVQMQSPAMAATRGRAEFAVFSLLPVMQSIMESKQSTLREGERKLIQEFIGNPAGFVESLFSLDETTIAKLKSIREVVARNYEVNMAGLQPQTIDMIQGIARPNASYYGWTPPEGATIRSPQISPEEELFGIKQGPGAGMY